MLLLHALLLFLLSISAMATPVPGRIVASEVENVELKQTYTFYYNSNIKKTEIEQKSMMKQYRGLWKTGDDKAPIVIYLHPTGLGIMNPMLMEEAQLKRVFTEDKKWNFLSYGGAKALEAEKLLPVDTVKRIFLLEGVRSKEVTKEERASFSYNFADKSITMSTTTDKCCFEVRPSKKPE